MTTDAPTDGAPTTDPSRAHLFKPGNTFGKGNPLAKKQAEFRRMFHEAVTADDLRAVARAMIDEAIDGDPTAARLVLEYTAGKPAAYVEDTDDGDKPPQLGRLEVRFVPASPVAATVEPGVA